MNSTQGVLNAKFRLLFPAVQRFVCQSYEKAEIAKRNGGIHEIFSARSLLHVDRWCPPPGCDTAAARENTWEQYVL